MRWGHGHSTLLGIIIGVAVIGGHLLWGLSLAFILGLLAGRFWAALSQLLRRLARRDRATIYSWSESARRWKP